MAWLTYRSGLTKDQADKLVRKLKRDGKKLEALGARSWRDIKAELEFDGPGRVSKFYRVMVSPIVEEVSP